MKKLLSVCLILLLLFGGVAMVSCGKTNEKPESVGGESIGASAGGESIGESAGGESQPGDVSEEITEPDENNLAYKCPYFYDCGIKVVGDDSLTILTDGREKTYASLSTSLDKGSGYTLQVTDWSGQSRAITLKNDTAAITVDLGFMSNITDFELALKDYSGMKAEVFYSTDGYNFSFYAGEFGVYEGGLLKDTLEITAKSVMFVLPITPTQTISVSEIKIFGSSEHKRKLLSLSAEYTIDGKISDKYPETGNKLTDGDTCILSGDQAVLGFTSSAKDDLTGKTGSVITLDLGEKKNVSEVIFGIYTPQNSSGNFPDRINARYSEDGVVWEDLGQSFLASQSGARGNSSSKYIVTRPFTVRARYIKIFTYTQTLILLDEVYVYGSENPVPEPDYGFINRKNQLSNTNAAAFVKAELNGKESAALTDLKAAVSVSGVSGENEITLSLSKSYDDICGAMIAVEGSEDREIKLFLDGAETAFTTYKVKAGKNTYIYLYFEETKAQKVKITYNAQKAPKFAEVSVYAAQPQLPLVRGGFFQLQTSGAGSNASANNSDYSWYLQLKGMKDLGMEYVVMQYSANYSSQTTSVNGRRITGAGYKYSPYGAEDLYESILSAADKLGMKVYLGTIHDSDFSSPIANMESYKDIVADSFLLIRDIYDMYHTHESFEGYYLSDEECDYWLNLTGGVDAGRYVYKNQSDLIREISPEAKVMIAPAIWQSGRPDVGADNLYRLIAPDKEGGRPVADIVAAQDCLGRLGTLYVEDGVFDSYESFVSEWAKAVRRAGAEFWHDMEIFEQIYTTKRYDEIVKSLGIEAYLSGSIIVFDIPHYFTTFPYAAFNNVQNYYKRLIMRDYVKYYAPFRALDGAGSKADGPEVQTDDGKKVDLSGLVEVTKPEKYDKVYNEGVLTVITPSAENLDALNWQPFKKNNAAADLFFAYSYDSENFYVCVRTNDATANYGKGVWWEGKDDLLQIWMVTTGKTAPSVLDNDHGLRYYIHRTEKGWTAGGSASPAVLIKNFTFTEKDGVFIVAMPWSNLGRTPPEHGDQTAIGVKVHYIDGAGPDWASTDGTLDQSIVTPALYSF